MASSIPALRFVRCPKCLKFLAEIPAVPLYKCGGCGVTLRAKVILGDEKTSNLASAAGSSKIISYSGSLDNKKESNEKLNLSTLNYNEDHNQAVAESVIVSGFSSRWNVEEFSRDRMKNHESGSDGERLEEKGKSPVYEQNGIKGINSEIENHREQGLPIKTLNNLNEEANKSSDQKIPAGNESIKSSYKLEEFPESLENDIISEDDKINGKFLRHSGMLLRSSISHAYDAGVSFTDDERRKQVPQKYLNLSRRTFGKRTPSVISRDDVKASQRDFSFISEDFMSALNGMESENHSKEFVKFKHTAKRGDEVKILRKVDELKNDLLKFFDRAADGIENSRLGVATHFERVPPKQSRPSLIPLSKQHPHGCHREHYRPCPHSACGNLPDNAKSGPLCMKQSLSPHQKAQNIQSNDKRPETVKRLCRPVSGGAPFVICYRCFNMLQLPADFLVSAKRVHKLRCGSCFEVLSYFFRPRTYLKPQTPRAKALYQPSKEKKKEVIDHEIRVTVSKDVAGVDSVSYSEEDDLYLGKSISYEAEPSRQISRYNSIVEKERRVEAMRGLQLHKLMGYSSARYLLFEALSASQGHRTGQDR